MNIYIYDYPVNGCLLFLSDLDIVARHSLAWCSLHSRVIFQQLHKSLWVLINQLKQLRISLSYLWHKSLQQIRILPDSHLDLLEHRIISEEGQIVRLLFTLQGRCLLLDVSTQTRHREVLGLLMGMSRSLLLLFRDTGQEVLDGSVWVVVGCSQGFQAVISRETHSHYQLNHLLRSLHFILLSLLLLLLRLLLL